MSSEMLSREMWFSGRFVVTCGEGLFTGMTDHNDRRERAKALIIRYDLAEKPCGKKDGKDVTFAAMFSRIYGAELRSPA